MLEIEGLTTVYGAVKAVDGVSLRVPEGAITAVLGANGAGKTTLLRTIGGLVRPRAGRILLRGKDIARMPAEALVRLGLAHVPEGGGVIRELTVAENLRLGALWRRDRREAARGIGEVGELFPPLLARLSRPASTLSGGERQMLAIGRALMSRPTLLLLDEPSLGLAPLVTARIMGVLRELRTRQGLTVLLVEQNARSALSISDSGVVLSLGQVVMTAPAGQLLSDVTLRHAYLGF